MGASRALGRFRVAFGCLADEQLLQPVHLFLLGNYFAWQHQALVDNAPPTPAEAYNAHARQVLAVAQQLADFETILFRMERDYEQSLAAAEQALATHRAALAAASRTRAASVRARERASLQSDRYRQWHARWTDFQRRAQALGGGLPRVGVHAPPPLPLRRH